MPGSLTSSLYGACSVCATSECDVAEAASSRGPPVSALPALSPSTAAAGTERDPSARLRPGPGTEKNCSPAPGINVKRSSPITVGWRSGLYPPAAQVTYSIPSVPRRTPRATRCSPPETPHVSVAGCMAPGFMRTMTPG
jgi:hypothetical protein